MKILYLVFNVHEVFIVQLDENFQVKIPKQIIKLLKLKAGDKLILEVHDNVVLLKKTFDINKWREKVSQLVGAWKDHPLIKEFGTATKAIKWLRGHENIC